MKLIKSIFLFSLALLLVTGCQKEDEFNQVDEQGRKQGPWKFYYETGQLKSEVQYVDDEKRGKETVYFPDGTINEVKHWDGDEFGTYLHGRYTHYYETGKPLKVMEYEEGIPSGSVNFFYRNGQRELQGSYMSGLKSGIWRYYDEEGNLVKTIDYHNSEQLWTDDFLAGRITYYDNQQRPFYTVVYVAGQVM